MRLIQADSVYPVTTPPVKNGILRVNDKGQILELIDPLQCETIPEAGTIEKFDGIICPGFINCHCHLELSNLKGKIPEKKGITGFIAGLQAVRNSFSKEEVQFAIQEAEKEMIANGIVAVGDISNTNDTFYQKSLNNLRYHTFIELFDLGDANADAVFEKGVFLSEELVKLLPSGHSCSMVPHSPYTVSDNLFSLLYKCANENASILTMHNQESESENELFVNKSGALFDFFTRMGIDMTYITPTGFNALRSSLVKLSNFNKTLLVHNTFTTADDLQWAMNYSKMITWCFCVNANLYIENRTPDIKLFNRPDLSVAMGTDSLASNYSLSILDEMKTLMRLNPFLSLQDVLKWATINGATFFNFNKTLGSLEQGKCPGINHIQNIDPVLHTLNESSHVTRLI